LANPEIVSEKVTPIWMMCWQSSKTYGMLSNYIILYKEHWFSLLHLLLVLYSSFLLLL